MATQIQKCSNCKTKKPLTIEFYNKKQSGFFNKKCINCNNIVKKSKLKSQEPKETIVVWKATEHNKRNIEIEKIKIQNELDGLRLKNSNLENFLKKQNNPIIDSQLEMLNEMLETLKEEHKNGNIKFKHYCK